MTAGLSLPTPVAGRFCVHRGTVTHVYYAFWIPPFIFDSFLALLAIFKSLDLRRSLGRSPFRQSGERLIDLLFRDSIIYFIAYVYAI